MGVYKVCKIFSYGVCLFTFIVNVVFFLYKPRVTHLTYIVPEQCISCPGELGEPVYLNVNLCSLSLCLLHCKNNLFKV